MEINDLHKHPIGREKAQKPQNRPWTGTGLVIESASLHSPFSIPRSPISKSKARERHNNKHHTICYWDCKCKITDCPLRCFHWFTERGRMGSWVFPIGSLPVIPDKAFHAGRSEYPKSGFSHQISPYTWPIISCLHISSYLAQKKNACFVVRLFLSLSALLEPRYPFSSIEIRQTFGGWPCTNEAMPEETPKCGVQYRAFSESKVRSHPHLLGIRFLKCDLFPAPQRFVYSSL
jgi:hypothetical protein